MPTCLVNIRKHTCLKLSTEFLRHLSEMQLEKRKNGLLRGLGGSCNIFPIFKKK